MNWHLKLVLIFIAMTFFGCEDVVDIDVPTEEPRLIVDALNRVDISSPTTTIRVKVRLTSSFFEPIPVTNLTDISFGNIGETFFEGGVGGMTENPDEPGTYETTTATEGLLSGRLILQLEHEGRLYFARTRFVPTVPINSLEQGSGTLFDDDDTEVIVSFTDAPGRTDYYLFDFNFAEFATVEDTFIDGQDFSFSYFYDRQFEPGTEIPISIMGADQEFYNYMNLLLEQSDDQLDVFSTPVATVRGNVFDVTGLNNIDIVDNVDRPEEFALGYFAIVQEFRDTLRIE